ncbi:MAG: LysR family transcriptional regulator [Gammaproteobacteria bacterium]
MTSALYYKQSRLKQLRAFCHTAQRGSISKAAEKLFLSQPSVSLQIQALERDLAVSLFERRGPSIKLTAEGNTLYELAWPLVKGMDTLPETFAAHRGNLETGELNIAAGESTILYILPDAIKKFSAAYPGIRVKLHNVTGRDGLAMLRADEVEFAVGSMLEVPEDIDYRPTVTYDPTLITPVDHPLAEKSKVTLEDISPYGLILPPRHLSTWRMVDLVFSQHGASYKVALEAGGWEVIKKYVELGLGVSIVTDVCLTGEEQLARISLSRYFPKRSYGIVLRQGKHLSPQAKRFIDMWAPEYFDRHNARGAAAK